MVGARMAGASVTKTAELFGVTTSTLSKVMAAFENERKTSSQKQNSERERKLSGRDPHILTRIVTKDYENIPPKNLAELSNKLKNPVSSKTIGNRTSRVGCNQKIILKLICLKFSGISIILFKTKQSV